MAEFKETNFEYIAGEKYGCFSSQEQKWVNKIKRYAEKYPNDIKNLIENKDGSICVNIPVKWFKVSPPRQISEEQKQKASERFKKMWEDKHN